MEAKTLRNNQNLFQSGHSSTEEYSKKSVGISVWNNLIEKRHFLTTIQMTGDLIEMYMTHLNLTLFKAEENMTRNKFFFNKNQNERNRKITTNRMYYVTFR